MSCILLRCHHIPLRWALVTVTGCASMTAVSPPVPPVTVLVAPVTLAVPLTASQQVQSFETEPAPDYEPYLRAQLLDELQQHAQAVLTAQLARQPGFRVVPFAEARRVMAEIASPGNALTAQQRQALAHATGADVILSGRILTYGAVRWQHWITGFALQEVAEFLIVGFGTGFNPVALEAWLGVSAVDAFVIDLPLWAGGGYLLGWAFRPVQVEAEAVQVTPCEGPIWHDEALTITIPRKTLAAYPEASRGRKEVQLGVNLERALVELADTAGQTLRPHPCTETGTVIRTWGERLRAFVGWGP